MPLVGLREKCSTKNSAGSRKGRVADSGEEFTLTRPVSQEFQNFSKHVRHKNFRRY
jgi:hypothetical protein